MDKKTTPIYIYICCLKETHFRLKDTHRLKVKRCKKILHGNGKEEKAGVAVLTPDKLGFKAKAIGREKEGHYSDKGNNPTRGRNPSKYLRTQHRST